MPTIFARLITAAALVLALAAGAAAADYPDRPIRLIVPFPPGGSNDVVGRLIAKVLSEKIGQQVFVDNRGGAGSMIGTEALAKATPDGYTLGIVSIAFAVNPALHTPLPYDPVKSFEPISILATGPNVLVVNPELPVKSVKELIALAKQKPGELNYASAGIGSFQHLGGELFKLESGVDIVHVPYKGGGPAMQDVVARPRQDHVLIADSDDALDQGRTLCGRSASAAPSAARCCRTCRRSRKPACPGYAANNWWGIFAPAGTPKPIVEKLYKDIQLALQSPEMLKEFEIEGAAPVTMTSAEFAIS